MGSKPYICEAWNLNACVHHLVKLTGRLFAGVIEFQLGCVCIDRMHGLFALHLNLVI